MPRCPVMLDRIGYQPRLDNSPFLRCLHSNVNSSFIVAALIMPFHHSTAYLQRHRFHVTPASALAYPPHNPKKNKEPSPRPISGSSMADTCSHEYQENRHLTSLADRTRYDLASTLLTLATPRFPGLPLFRAHCRGCECTNARVALMLVLQSGSHFAYY
jgi:hypothetical protein